MRRYLHIITALTALTLTSSPAAAQTSDTQIPIPLPVATPSDAAPTEWKICNQTSYILRIANAYMRSGRMEASGWRELNSGVCLSESTPPQSQRFLYAESSPVHQGDIREWAGTVELCTAQTDFSSDAASECSGDSASSSDLTPRKFLVVDPAELQTDLIEPAEFGDKAETAGFQRLLKDSGYKISRIDGVSGRRTTRTLKTFKKDHSVESGASTSEVFSALIEAAKEASTSTGLEICNDSSAPIWSAIATRHQGGWQSRGWWDIAPGTCDKPYNAPLEGTETHIFALQESTDTEGTPLPDKHLRTVSTVPSQFCIAEAKFSALGREFCTENGYNVANFRPVSTDNDGAKITLTDTDFADSNPEGLRR